MQRISTSPRKDWQGRVEHYGLSFHTIDGETYWDESAYYHFTAREVDLLDDVTNELHQMCMDTVAAIITERRFEPFCIPETVIPLILDSWEQQQPSLYGRFDFVYDGTHPPKLLEYNADTPTALLEASVIQWFWLQDVNPEADQFNSIHERLLERWDAIRSASPEAENPTLYFGSVAGHEEDFMTVAYLRDVAIQAGWSTDYLSMDQIGWSEDKRRFVDLQDTPINRMFKLYPWEWIVHEEFGQYLPQKPAQFIEPIWKMLLSNKAILPILWERYPNHPNLLQASFTPFSDTYVQKPILAREGANVTLVRNGQVAQASAGEYTDSPLIYQDWCPLPNFSNNYPIIGSWIVGDTACGIGIREDASPITQNTSRFVPHLFTE